MIVFSMNLGWISSSKFFSKIANFGEEFGYFIYFLSLIASGIQLKESRIPLTIGIQNPSSTDRDWYPVPGNLNSLTPGDFNWTAITLYPFFDFIWGEVAAVHSLQNNLVADHCRTSRGQTIMSLLCGCACYSGFPIMRVSLLCGDPYYAGVPIMRGSLLSEGPSK